jgi:hypothetical protein
MATSLNSCAGESVVSFPLQTSISDLNSYYKQIEKPFPNILIDYTTRLNNPNFSDETRNSGEIDEPLNSITVNYNNNEYRLLNTQITTATHSDWIPNPNPSKPIQNKIDLIITLETQKEGIVPRFVIIVVPIVVDDTATVNNPYLAGLAYLTNDSIYSLSSVFNGLTQFIDYTTCLAPHGDKAFVYVNVDTIKINSDLYHNLLSIWTQQSLTSIQTKILDNLSPVQKSLSKLFQNVKDAKNLQQIQQQINNIQATAQTPVINTMVETWPRYSPPYDIILNVPTKPITESTQVEGFQTREGFQVRFTIRSNTGGSGGSGGSDGSDGSGGSGSSSYSIERARGDLKCVPLDMDDAIDGSGNVIIDASGNLAFGQVEARRKQLRSYYDSNNISTEELLKWSSVGFSILLVIGVIYFFAWPFMRKYIFKVDEVPLPPGATQVGSYIVFTLIILFAGFLIGAAVARAY